MMCNETLPGAAVEWGLRVRLFPLVYFGLFLMFAKNVDSYNQIRNREMIDK